MRAGGDSGRGLKPGPARPTGQRRRHRPPPVGSSHAAKSRVHLRVGNPTRRFVAGAAAPRLPNVSQLLVGADRRVRAGERVRHGRDRARIGARLARGLRRPREHMRPPMLRERLALPAPTSFSGPPYYIEPMVLVGTPAPSMVLSSTGWRALRSRRPPSPAADARCRTRGLTVTVGRSAVAELPLRQGRARPARGRRPRLLHRSARGGRRFACARPCRHVCAGTLGWAHPAHICTGTDRARPWRPGELERACAVRACVRACVRR